MTIASLSPSVVAYLSALSYRPDAARQVCWIPLGGLYWEDEIPDIRDLMQLTEDDQLQLFRLFAIRYKLWEGEGLNAEDRQFWDGSRSQVPHAPIFQRLQLSAADKKAHAEARQASTDALETLFADADRVTLTEHGSGVQTFSATFDLTKCDTANDDLQAVQNKSWWGRLLSRKWMH